MRYKETLYLLLVLAAALYISDAQTRQDIEKQMEEEQRLIEQMQNDYLDYEAQVEEDFRLYQGKITQEYEAYEHQLAEELAALQREIEAKWEDFRFDTKVEMVDYDDTKDARTSVNFKDGQIEIEAIVEADTGEPAQLGMEKLETNFSAVFRKKGDDGKPIIADQVKNEEKQTITEENSKSFFKEAVKKFKIRRKRYKSRDGKERIKYSMTVPMVPEHLAVRAQKYKSEVLKQAKRFEINPELAFAVMHTESCFNPNARSYIPAFGLMQLVPKSGARDAYIYIYKEDKFLTGDYLYIPENNIELGCAYLSKIRHVYFKDIKDDNAAYYCSVAAYNTGIGNVARALTGTTKLGAASSTVNSHNSDWVYNKLVKDLPYSETRDYLKKVTDRTAMYAKWI